MLFSAHLFESGPIGALRRVAPIPDTTGGLLSARTAICAPFTHSWIPKPQFRREAMLACWSDEAALDRFLETDPLGQQVQTGWHARLELLRAVGIFPGMDPADIAAAAGDKHRTHQGPSVALTLGTAYLKSAPTFLRVNKGLDRQFIDTPAGIWGTAMTNPRTRFVATLTFWESLDAATDYVRTGAHGAAAKEHYDPAKDPNGHTFVTDGGFLGFKPLSLHGSIGGANPIGADLLV